ncbi:hypothetical protein [Mitsuaria sp. GD03876]|uniref:hypothetical protein n=1 Tax=Mitsuaria sp. GD03876 TaxID=2975399 RepID=UPI0024488F3C|nr:hypothetical protein [Mitsuaria sp. GD03876]MDH0863966.1 hypothetical protein [Mitsuaria sp. GD03876]
MTSWMNDWQEDCERVGLEAPSTDLVEIKRAYAKTLRKTRPDDDAQAYQALREAYDRLVAFARRQQAMAAEAAAEAAAAAEADGGTANTSEALRTAGDTEPAAATPVEAMAPPRVVESRTHVEPLVADAPTPIPATAGSPTTEIPVPVDDADVAMLDREPPPPPPLPPAPPPIPRPRAERPAPPPLAMPMPQGPTPEALCNDLVDLLKRGPAKVEAALPALRVALGELPLASQVEASARFADLAIALQDHLPGALLDLLRDHFDWSRDFRTERLLGAERMAALAEVLDRRPMPITDPDTLAEFGPSVRVAQLAGSQSDLDQIKAFFGALLMGHALLLHLQWAGWQLLRRFGLDEAEITAVNKVIGRVRNLAVVHIAALVAALDLALRHEPGAAFERGLSALMSLVIFCTAMGLVCRVLDFLRDALPDWLKTALSGGRWEKASPWVGAAAFALGGAALEGAPLIQGDVGAAIAIGGVIVLIAGILLGLKGPLHLVVTATALWGFLVLTLPSTNLLGAGLLAAWVSAGTSIYRLRLYVPNPDFRIQPRWPTGGAKAMLALLTIGLPTMMSWLASISGMRLTLGAITIAYSGTSSFLADTARTPRALILVGALYLTLAFGLAAQRAGWWIGRKLFHSRSGSGSGS